MPERCGATDWGYCDDGRPHVYGICDREPHPDDRAHREHHDGGIWAEWSGDTGPIPAGDWCEHSRDQQRFHTA